MSAYTEQEAKGRWCPFARAAEPQWFGSGDPMAPVAAVNRGSDANMDPDYQPNVLCLGSRCMAWRWLWSESWRTDDRDRDKYRGYCGLAGKAQP